MNYDKNIYAEVVYNGSAILAPTRMGEPKADQLQGNTLEQLAELAGRVCYDSLGKGRSSAEYHKHIAQVGHGSVWEHANFTVQVSHENRAFLGNVAAQCINHPGVHVIFPGGSRPTARITLNLRAAVEWEALDQFEGPTAYAINAAVLLVANGLAPQIATEHLCSDLATTYGFTDLAEGVAHLPGFRYNYAPPVEREEKWVSLLLGGSRGMSHEQVRHKFRTAVSQRSTRYVDEDGSPWVEHPLFTQAQADRFGGSGRPDPQDLVHDSQQIYRDVVADLEPFMLNRGADKHTARKQARGVARGYLGNALATEMIFSASVAQWCRMIEQRCTIHADAEIRVLYGKILQALRTTLWAKDFEDFKLVPSPDGIGEVIE